MSARVLVLGLLAGCAAESALNADMAADTGAAVLPTTAGEVELRVDVYPAELLSEAGDYRALPQSLGRFRYAGDALDFGILELRRPVRLSGVVIGNELGPSYAAPQLPGVDVALVEAAVRVHKDDSVQDYAGVTDVDGQFEIFVVPQETYRLEVVPTDPRVPMLVQELQVESSAPVQQIDVGAGVPIFGTVRDLGAPLAGAAVAAMTADGVVTAGAFTDGLGNYELRVQPGEAYTVACSGREFELDPVLLAGPTEVGEVGVRQDFQYPSLTPVLVDGRVEDADGAPLGGVTVRFTSDALSAYGDLDHTTQVEVLTSNDGTFTRRLLAGVYTVEYVPAAGEQPRDDQTPLRLESVVVRGGALTLPTQRMSSLITAKARLVDTLGDGVGFARIACQELDFEQRAWSTEAGGGGFFELRVSRLPLLCTLTPPGDRLDLPLTTVFVDPEDMPGELRFESGVPVSGAVRVDGRPEPFAFVELTGDDGRRYGSALTNGEGAFQVWIPRP